MATSPELAAGSGMERLVVAIQYLTEDTFSRKPAPKVEEAVKVIQHVSKDTGLEPDSIEVLMDFVVGNGVSKSVAVRSRLLRCLIPSTSVPVAAFYRCLGSMRTLPSGLQDLLFKWMVLVFDFLDHVEKLRSLYDVVFHYLGYDGLRAPVCQLLCYITTKSHVKEFRVQRLMELSKQVMVLKGSSESPLMALLTLYKMHCPHLVPMPNQATRKIWFRKFERPLANSIERVQRNRPVETLTTRRTCSLDKVTRCLGAVPPPAKRRRLASIPILCPSHSQAEMGGGSLERGVPIATMTSVQELCENIHRLESVPSNLAALIGREVLLGYFQRELPGRVGAVLESQLFQHAFAMWPDPALAFRLSYWLEASLGPDLDDYVPGSPEQPHLLHRLACAAQLTEFLLEPLPTMETFLQILLECWNGEDYQDQVFKLLSFSTLQPFENMATLYLNPLQRLYVGKGVKFKCRAVACLTDLLRFWGGVEWTRYCRRGEASLEGDEQHLRLCIFSSSNWNSEDGADFEARDAIRLLVCYTETLLRIALFQERGHALIKHAAATFYEVVMALPEEYGVSLLLVVPHPQVVHHCLLSTEPAVVSRILSCYVRCKKIFQKKTSGDREVEAVRRFNSVVLDIHDSLWSEEAFPSATTAPNSNRASYPSHLFTLTREQLEGRGFKSVHNKLSIVHHPALLATVKDFFRETQGQNYARFKPSAIWKEEKFWSAYLEYLQKRLLHGIPDFISTFVKTTTGKPSAVSFSTTK